MEIQMLEQFEHVAQQLWWKDKHESVGCYGLFYAFLPFSLAAR